MNNSFMERLVIFGAAMASFVTLPCSAQISRYSTFPEQKIVRPSRVNASARSSDSNVSEREVYNRTVSECIKQNEALYQSASEYPATLSDGWHTAAYHSEGLNACENTRYLVENNRIVKWNYGKDYVDIKNGGLIKEGKAIYYMEVEGSGNLYFTAYFMDDIFRR